MLGLISDDMVQQGKRTAVYISNLPLKPCYQDAYQSIFGRFASYQLVDYFRAMYT